MTIADKLIETMLQYTPGTVVRTQDILATMQERYPEVPIGSIRPADFCDNWVNKDPVSGKVHIFHRALQIEALPEEESQFYARQETLFVGTRVFIIPNHDNKGAPQGWSQIGMYTASWTQLIRFVMVVISCTSEVPDEIGEDDNIIKLSFP